MSRVQRISSCSKTFMHCCFQRGPEWCNSEDQGWLKIARKIVTMLKKGVLKLGGYLESAFSYEFLFQNHWVQFYTEIGLGIKWGTLLASQEKVCFPKSNLAVTPRNVCCKTSVGLSWPFLVGNQSFGILQVVVAVRQFRGSLAMDLYTVDLSLLETLTFCL